jgi:hypothetical protein
MMLDQRLNDAAAGVKRALSELVPPPVEELDPVVHRRVPVVRWKPAVVAAAAFVAVLVVVGAAGLVLRGDGTAAVEESTPTPMSLEWLRVPHDEAVFGGDDDQAIHSVTVGGPGFVAVGDTGVRASSGDRDAAVWTSPDGITWSRVPDNDAVFGGDGAQVMESVTVGGPGLVAVGLRFDEPGSPGLRPAVWTSSDGVAWTPAPFDRDDFGGDDGWMHSVTAGGPGLVAAGSDRWSAAVWTSPDGITWSRVPHDPEVFGIGLDARDDWGFQTEMRSVTVGGPGLVAVGSSTTGAGSESSDGITFTHHPGSGSAVVWTSPDGMTWTRIPHDEAVFGGEGHQAMSSVAVAGPGLVAVGSSEGYTVESDSEDGLISNGSRAAVWISPDGITWTRVPHDETIFGPTDADPDQRMSSVIGVGPGVVAVGGATWTSPDGTTWNRLASDSDTGFNDITSDGPRLVAVGGVQVGNDDDGAAVFIARLGS